MWSPLITVIKLLCDRFPGPVVRREARALVVLALPLALGDMAFVVITTTDILMMGWLGERYLAAGSLGLNVVWLVEVFALGTVSAVGPLCAQALGARSPRGVRRSVRQGFWVALTLTPPVLLVMWHAGDLLVLLGQDPELSRMASPYVRAVLWGVPPSLGTVVLWELYAAHERPRLPMAVAGLAIGVNALADYVLIFGWGPVPAYGLVGAGVASAVVSWGIFLGLLIATLRDRQFRRYHLFARFWRTDWPRYRELFRVGLPLGMALLFEMGFFAASTFLVGRYDPAALGAHAVALQITGFVFVAAWGLSHAATIRVGFNAGAADAEGVRRSGWTALNLALLFMVGSGLLLLIQGEVFMELFSDSEAPASSRFVKTGVLLLTIAAGFLMFDAGRAVLLGALAGLKDTRVPMLMQAFGFWGVGLGSAWTLAALAGLGAAGVWLGITIGTMAAFAPLLMRWRLATTERGLRPLVSGASGA